MAVRDVVLTGALVFALGIGLFVMFKITGDVITNMVNVPIIANDTTVVQVLNNTLALRNRFDYIVFGLFIGLVLAVMITGWFVAGSPLFMFLYFLGIIISVILSAILANVWETTTAMAVFGTSLASFPITNHIILQLPIYSGIVGFVGLVVMFAKPFLLGGSAGGEY